MAPPAVDLKQTNKWHPPQYHDGAMVYEGNEASPYQNPGCFETVTISGQIYVTPLGTVIIILPTADPFVVGALWNNAGTITISAGPPPP